MFFIPAMERLLLFQPAVLAAVFLLLPLLLAAVLAVLLAEVLLAAAVEVEVAAAAVAALANLFILWKRAVPESLWSVKNKKIQKIVRALILIALKKEYAASV